MSHNEKLCGIAYKLEVPKEDRGTFMKQVYPDKDVDKYIEEWGDDWFSIFINDVFGRQPINKWIIMCDINGEFGWVFLTDSGESFGDINMSLTLTDINNYITQVKEANLFGVDEVDPNKVRVFAIDWYNGCDCPLKF